jgi:transcriptional regulator with XRE-family HTH domain
MNRTQFPPAGIRGAAQLTAERRSARDRLPAPAERRAIREATGVTRKVIADQLAVTETAVWRWETGLSDPSNRYLFEYLAILDELRRIIDGLPAEPSTDECSGKDRDQ